MSLSVDYDDVDHPTVRREVKRLCTLLNKYWGKQETKTKHKTKLAFKTESDALQWAAQFL